MRRHPFIPNPRSNNITEGKSSAPNRFVHHAMGQDAGNSKKPMVGVAGERGFSFYDRLAIAAARATQCQILYLEDLQHGQLVGNVRIVNPFLQVVNESSI